MSLSALHSYEEILTILVFLSQLFAMGRYRDVLSPQNCQDESEGKYIDRINQEVSREDQSGDSYNDRLKQEVTTETGSIRG